MDGQVAGGWRALQPGPGGLPAVVLKQAPEQDPSREEPARVWLHNDDVTPAEYVVTVLEQAFGLGWWRANWIMLRAHVTGQALVGQYPRHEAAERVAAAHRRARAEGWPLRFSVEIN